MKKKIEYADQKHKVAFTINEELMLRVEKAVRQILESYSGDIRHIGLDIPLPDGDDNGAVFNKLGDMVSELEVESLFTINDMMVSRLVFQTLDKCTWKNSK